MYVKKFQRFSSRFRKRSRGVFDGFGGFEMRYRGFSVMFQEDSEDFQWISKVLQGPFVGTGCSTRLQGVSRSASRSFRWIVNLSIKHIPCLRKTCFFFSSISDIPADWYSCERAIKLSSKFQMIFRCVTGILRGLQKVFEGVSESFRESSVGFRDVIWAFAGVLEGLRCVWGVREGFRWHFRTFQRIFKWGSKAFQGLFQGFRRNLGKFQGVFGDVSAKLRGLSADFGSVTGAFLEVSEGPLVRYG